MGHQIMKLTSPFLEGEGGQDDSQGVACTGEKIRTESLKVALLEALTYPVAGL